MVIHNRSDGFQRSLFQTNALYLILTYTFEAIILHVAVNLAHHSDIDGTTNPSLASYMSSKLMEMEPDSNCASGVQTRLHVAERAENQSILHSKVTSHPPVTLHDVFNDSPSSSNTHLSGSTSSSCISDCI